MGRMLRLVSFLLVLQMLFLADLHFAVAADPPQLAPAPAPAPEIAGTHSSSPIGLPPSPETGAPSPGPSSEYNSPPAPTPSDLGSTPSPTPSPEISSPAPTPDASDINHNAKGAAQDETVNSDPATSGGGLTGGQKAGVAVGIIAAACIVGLAGIVYKKRQDNIRRTQYGYAVRRELL
ncbi:classical arabinogalactan protein 6-like [Macadamia integrifolia]|uniref:classical arabinogalactan protein 6-like n=1 Tax=Macadamia integrifolia TaxID=60698 RepID=UPI001C52D98B|nr:classical arabinogalactan protein 6-like [Macadamia integrifolia]